MTEHEEVTRELARGLPEYYPSSPENDNYTLLEAIGDRLTSADEDIGEVNSATTIQDADSLDELQALGELVDTPPRDGETLEHYRARLLAEYSIVTSKATIEDLLETASEILSMNQSGLTYGEPSAGEHGTAELGVPAPRLDDLNLSNSDLVNILDRIIPAGYRLNVFQRGTFTYITPGDYNSDLHDADLGYDGLDGNGDPKDTGGTYSGVIS